MRHARCLPAPALLAPALLATLLAAQAPLEITITSSPHGRALAEAAGAVVQRKEPGICFKITSASNARVLRDVARAEVMAGLMARELTASERAAHEDVVASPLAVDGLSVVVHGSNPVRALTSVQLADVYLGKIKNWAQVGGPDLAIEPLVPSPEESVFEAFADPLRLELGSTVRDRIRKIRLRLRGTYQDGTAAAEVIANTADMLISIGARPGALGLVPVTCAQRAQRRGGGVRALTLDDVVPSVVNVRNGEYPLRQTLYLLTKGHPAGRVNALIEFVRSPKGEDVLAAHDLLPLSSPAAVPLK